MNKPAFLLVGDSFSIEEKEKVLLRDIAREYPGEIARQTFRAGEIPLQTILTQARTLPFLVSAQVFRIYEGNRLKKEDLEVLIQYLRNPAPATRLIFWEESLEAKDALPGIIAEYGEVLVPSKQDKRTLCSRFIQEKLRSFSKTMTPGARQRLEDEVGQEPSFLDSILDRLILYAGDRKEINEEMLDLFEEKLSGVDTFRLADAVANRNVPLALRLLKDFLEHNEKELVPLFGLLHWQLRRLWQASMLLEEGKPENVILKKCRVSYKQSGFFLKQARAVKRSRVERAIQDLFRLDWNMKTGRVEGPAGLECWVIQSTMD